MISSIKNTDNTKYQTKRNVFKKFQTSANLHLPAHGGLREMRVKSTTHKLGFWEKSGVIIGSIAGTVLPMIYFAKRQNAKIYNLNFGLAEMITVGAGSIAGGVLGGILSDKSKNHKNKINEGIFQFFNASVPPLVFAGLTKIQDKTKFAKNKIVSAINTVVGLTGGMFLAAKISNLVIDPHDKVPDRKLTMKDAVVNIDDALGVFALAKFPFIDKLHPEKVLPAIYAWCGYRAGQSN